MSIPSSHMKERISAAYVEAVAARAGIKLFGRGVTEYGVDGYFQKIRQLATGKFKEAGPTIQCQIKASTRTIVHDSEVVYDMKVEAYNKLVDVEEDDPPTIFILFRVPPESQITSWLTVSDDELVIRHCCYWDHITGSSSSNKEWHRVKIPIQQRLTPDVVADFFVMLKEGKL